MWNFAFALVPAIVSTLYSRLLLAPTVRLDGATVIGKRDGDVDQYLGLTYAQAPRFRLPVAVEKYTGRVYAQEFGPTCIQQTLSPTSSHVPLPPPRQNQAEECLSLNVVVPKGTNPGDNLPVAFIIHGGGFQIGSSSGSASGRVKRSIELGLPMILVTINYRLSAYGFIAGKEVLEDGVSNIAIYDQREALKWVNRYIYAFGGDPSRVTINGGSAGGVSVVYQMLAFGGNNDGLFAAAFAQSGSFLSSSPTSRGQVHYDKLIKDAGCAESSDTLECLRNISLDTLREAVDKSPDIFSYRGGAIVWTPHVDGNILQDSPFNLVRDGKIAKVPLVIGNMDDEGTNFALQYTNHTSDGHFEDWVHKYWFPDAPRSSLDRLFELYPSTPAEGSPFGTGDSNQLYPQFKRTAAFAGDAIFQSPRRYLVRELARKGEQKLWCYASTKLKNTPIMGSFHGSDYATGFLDDSLIYFVNYHDPNIPADSALTGGMLAWPEYSGAEGSQGVYTFNDEGDPVLTTDTFREEAIEELTRLSQEYPIF